SIFVNPPQFNDPADLEKYPRPISRDIELLHGTGCDILFLPEVGEIYPQDIDTSLSIHPGRLAEVMEGEFRPGHFEGVMQVVHRLLDLVRPHILVMGQKDYQQVAVVRYMLEATRSPVQLHMSATIREADGLAMSSRNVRLTPAFRAIAPVICQTLAEARELIGRMAPQEIMDQAIEQLTAAGLTPEYFRIVDGMTLEEVSDPGQHEQIVACTAAWAGDVRLIDNMVLRP
ncbi:MAG TPA: pantoate--beta-alanine ligase, partial [Saprospiraceae bacterium]|nr:pantoate--beta-alanine ligase [Saprospiraceae bacterium]